MLCCYGFGVLLGLRWVGYCFDAGADYVVDCRGCLG